MTVLLVLVLPLKQILGNSMGLTNRDKFYNRFSIYKQGKFTPMSRIPIKPDEAISDLKKPLVLILSWNIKNHLKDIIYSINPRSEFY